MNSLRCFSSEREDQSAGSIYQNREEHPGAYQKMGGALLKAGRPIVYSLCNYGSGDVWKWGAQAGGNLWRTTFDIGDRWESMERIGFGQLEIVEHTKAGHWNDPDMLEVGNGGMTADEYRLHMSLWCMLQAPLADGGQRFAHHDRRDQVDSDESRRDRAGPGSQSEARRAPRSGRQERSAGCGNSPATRSRSSSSDRKILMNPDAIAPDQDRNPKPVERRAPDGKSEVLVAATHRQRGRGRALQPRRSRGGNRLPVGQPPVRIGAARLR